MSAGLRRLRTVVIGSALAIALATTPASGATPPPPSALWVSASVVDLGPVGIGTTTPDTTVTITNVSSSFVGSFAGGAGSNPDWLVASSCASGLAAGASCTMFFRVTPSHTGADTTTSTTSTSAGDYSITAKATGIGGKLYVSTTNVNLGPVPIGTTTPDTTVTVTNVGKAKITDFAGGGSSNPDWLIASSCALGLDPGKSCTMFFRVTPSAAGATSVVSQTSTSVGGYTITAKATGVPGQLLVSPTTLDAGPVPLGRQGTVDVTVTNVGPAPVPAWNAGTPSNSDFSLSTNCVRRPRRGCELPVRVHVHAQHADSRARVDEDDHLGRHVHDQHVRHRDRAAGVDQETHAIRRDPETIVPRPMGTGRGTISWAQVRPRPAGPHVLLVAAPGAAAVAATS